MDEGKHMNPEPNRPTERNFCINHGDSLKDLVSSTAKLFLSTEVLCRFDLMSVRPRHCDRHCVIASISVYPKRDRWSRISFVWEARFQTQPSPIHAPRVPTTEGETISRSWDGSHKTNPKDPGMSKERDSPYLPILRMGLEPSFLF